MIPLQGRCFKTRFFDVAARLTGASGLGLLRLDRGVVVSSLLRLCGLRPAIHHLSAISACLLAANLELVESLLERGELRSPLARDGSAVMAKAFDEAMVVFEQLAVEDYLRRHFVDAAARRGIDRLFAACASPWIARLFGVDQALSRAVRRCSSARASTFFAIETRIAIGLELVRPLRGRPAERRAATRAD